MDWGQILGKVVPGGAVMMGAGLIFKEWKTTPYIEGRVKLTPILNTDLIDFSIRVSNRSERPLIVSGYEVEQRVFNRNADYVVEVGAAEHRFQPDGADLSGRVSTDIRIEPFMPSMTVWPSQTIEGRVEAISWSVNRLVVTVFAAHHILGIRRERLSLKFDLNRFSTGKPIIPRRPRLEQQRE